MAAPVTHIVFAFLVAHLLPTHFDFKEFIVGTSFPDIRYAAKLSRPETHPEPVSWDTVIKASTAFEAGILFHNLLDILRMEYLDVPFFQEHTDVTHRTSASVLKVAEDSTLFSLLSQQEWEYVIDCFNVIYPEEVLRAHEDREVVERWHHALQSYFIQGPSIDAFIVFIRTMDGKHSFTQKSFYEYEAFLADTRMKWRIITFYKNFISLILEGPAQFPVTTPEWVYTATVWPTLAYATVIY